MQWLAVHATLEFYDKGNRPLVTWDAKSFMPAVNHVGARGHLVGKGATRKKKAAVASSNKWVAMTTRYVLCMHVVLFGACIVQRSIFYKNIILFFYFIFHLFILYFLVRCLLECKPHLMLKHKSGLMLVWSTLERAHEWAKFCMKETFGRESSWHIVSNVHKWAILSESYMVDSFDVCTHEC